MRRAIPFLLLSLVLPFGAPARAADPWGIAGEKALVVAGQVVDVLCHLKQDCPAQCGGGRRQLGLLDGEGTLRLVAKGQIDFANGVPDLLPYCGQRIEADGLLIENPAITLFFVQRIRAGAAGEFQPAERFLQEWSARHGHAMEWYREDPEVKAIIAEKGVLGIKGLALQKP